MPFAGGLPGWLRRGRCSSSGVSVPMPEVQPDGVVLGADSVELDSQDGWVGDGQQVVAIRP